MPIRDFRDLIVWQQAVELAADIYQLTVKFPADERFGMTNQLRRASVSVSSNIAEGSGRGTTRDLVKFLTDSRGSLFETHSLLLVGQRLDFLTSADVDPVVERVDGIRKMLSRLRSNLRANPTRYRH